MFKLDDRGFTLIELVVVIAILGMLAGLTIPNVIKIQEKARLQVNNSNMEILNSAANMAIVEEGLPELEIIWKEESFEKPGQKFIVSEYIDKWPSYPKKDAGSYTVTIGTDGKVSVEDGIK